MSDARSQIVGNFDVRRSQAPAGCFRPDRQPRHPSPRSGQAAIEFVAGLLLLLLLLAGIVHVNRMARTSLFLHSVLRGMAGERAMSNAISSAPEYVADWEAGPDGVRYTADDQPVGLSDQLTSTLTALSGYSVRHQDDWLQIASDTRLPVSQFRIQSSPLMAATLGFVHVEETLHVPVDPFIRQLVYDKDEVAIKEEVWMPLMGGLY